MTTRINARPSIKGRVEAAKSRVESEKRTRKPRTPKEKPVETIETKAVPVDIADTIEETPKPKRGRKPKTEDSDSAMVISLPDMSGISTSKIKIRHDLKNNVTDIEVNSVGSIIGEAIVTVIKLLNGDK